MHAAPEMNHLDGLVADDLSPMSSSWLRSAEAHVDVS